MTIEFGWWLLPLSVTFAAFVWQWRVHKDERPAGDYAVIGAAFGRLITFMAAVVVSLIAWLVYAILV